MYRFLIRTSIVLLAILLAAALVPARAAGPAQPRRADGVELSDVAGGVRLAWRGTLRADAARGAVVDGWDAAAFGGRMLPVRTIALQIHGSQPVVPVVEALETSAWSGPAPPAADAAQPIEGPAALPTSPLTVLREGRAAGTRIAVLALTPLFMRNGRLEAVRRIVARVDGAGSDLSAPAGDSARLSSQPAEVSAAVAPSNPLVGRPALLLRVSTPGLQRVTGAALEAAGQNLAALNPALLQLWHKGAPVPLHALGTEDGQLQPADELRFYAASAGDRWNTSAPYWLTVEAQPGTRIAQRGVQPQSAPLRDTARESGSWRQPTIYDSQHAGPGGDHWFSATLRSGPGLPDEALPLALPSTLPPVPGDVAVTVAGSAAHGGALQLRATAGASSATSAPFGPGDAGVALSLPENAASLSLALLRTASYAEFGLQQLSWRRPVRLDFGGQGAAFEGETGRWRYRLSGQPAGFVLYDVSDPAAPAVLDLGPQSAEFEDPLPSRSYLLAGPGTLHAPQVTAYQAAGLPAPLNADAVYVAPAAFHAALAPLVEQRRGQGYSVAVVDVQAIYDGWSFGYVAPEAIRRFVQYAAATSARAPRSVVLVGDGTSDPHNYLGRNNVNWVPPYLAMVDPWLGETACESCYGQLDGADPLDDALPDVAVGRLPVKSAAELSALVAKLLGYERAPIDLAAGASVALFADNYRDASGVADDAGDFAAFSEAAVAELSPGMNVNRVYYDPFPASTSGPGREADPVAAHQRVLAALNAGSSLAVYTGHSHYWQWASTDLSSAQTSMLDLYDPDGLTNGNRLSVLLEMTCLTSAFQEPAVSGTTIDERLLLRSGGGAAAVWGPTGLGVSHGHEALLRGFLRALRASAPRQATLGSLTDAGYRELFASSPCCQDTLRTFAVLGDPLMVPRIAPARRIFAPSIVRK